MPVLGVKVGRAHGRSVSASLLKKRVKQTAPFRVVLYDRNHHVFECPVALEQCLCLRIAGGRRAVEKFEIVRAVFNAVPQYINCPPLADLPLQPGQEFVSRSVVSVVIRLPQPDRLRQLWVN